jgi:hypothetical protein
MGEREPAINIPTNKVEEARRLGSKTLNLLLVYDNIN